MLAKTPRLCDSKNAESVFQCMWQRSYNFVYAALDNLYRMSCRACLAKLIKRNAARRNKCLRHALNFKQPFIIAEHNIDGTFQYFYTHTRVAGNQLAPNVQRAGTTGYSFQRKRSLW